MKCLWLLLLTVITSISGFAQKIDRLRLDSLFDRLSTNNLAIGTICITQNGRIVYQRPIGKDQTAGTAYRIGSITKVFTAVLIYELIDQKKLTFENTLGEFFPELSNSGRITIAEMLGHRSGLANFTAPATKFDSWKFQPQTQEQLLGYIRSQQPDFAPNDKADYNNSNFLLLGYILEKTYHKPYKDIVQERIIRKLGLPNTYYGERAGFEGRETASFKYADNQWKQEQAVYLDNFGGAGAMISTPQDLCYFIKAIFDGKFISKSSLDRMTRIEKDGYGWGMFPYGDSLYRGYGHNGKTEGFASSIQYYPDSKLAISYCTSGEVYSKDIILNDVFKICVQEPIELPTFDTVTLTQQQLQPLTGTYTGDNDLQVSSSIINGRLVIAVKGQPFALDALSDHEFRNVRFGFFFEFQDGGKQLVVHDVETTYWLHKQ